MATITEDQVRENLSIFADEHEDEYFFLREQKEKADEGEDVPKFFLSLWNWIEQRGELTAKQLEALNRTVPNALNGESAPKPTPRPFYPRRKPDPEATPCPEGQQAISGRIIKLAFKQDRYGTHLKATVLDDRGFKVWGNVPNEQGAELSAMLSQFEEGITDITELPANCTLRFDFIANVVKSDRDPSFGFFKRPRGCCVRLIFNT